MERYLQEYPAQAAMQRLAPNARAKAAFLCNIHNKVMAQATRWLEAGVPPALWPLAVNNIIRIKRNPAVPCE